MTTDTKQPPRPYVSTLRDPMEWAKSIDDADLPRWPHCVSIEARNQALATLIAQAQIDGQLDGQRDARHTYDEERREWERQVKEARSGNEGLRSSSYALETRVEGLKRECDALRSQVTALTEERDRIKTLTDELDITTAGRWRALAIEERARADRAEKERDEARASETTALGDALKLLRERDRAIAERDELGCQLEALRSIQRGDVADLRTRMEAVERAILQKTEAVVVIEWETCRACNGTGEGGSSDSRCGTCLGEGRVQMLPF